MRQRSDEERAGGDRDAVAEVGDDLGGEQPPEAPPEPRRGDGVDGAGRKESHRRQDTNRRAWSRRRRDATMTASA